MKKVLGLMGIVLTIAVCLAAFVAYSGAVVYAVDEPDFPSGPNSTLAKYLPPKVCSHCPTTWQEAERLTAFTIKLPRRSR